MRRHLPALLALFAICPCLIGCGPSSYQVTYKVTTSDVKGDDPVIGHIADITTANATGGTEQFDKTALNWHEDFTVSAGGHLYLAAQNQSMPFLGESKYNSDITCEILVNGVSYKKSTSTGDASIASCSGVAGD